MTVERLSGNLLQAVASGWRALKLHRSDEDRCYVLVSLGGCFLTLGELDAAEDSYAIVAERVARRDWRFAALENLAHVSALRGDRARFEERIARVDGSGWREEASTLTHAEVLQMRGLSWGALGAREAARIWLTRARDYAQEQGVHRVYFECESALKGLERGGAGSNAAPDTPLEPAPHEHDLVSAELAEIRGGIGSLRRELVPA